MPIPQGFQKAKLDLSLAIGLPMLEALKASPAPFGLTECSTCRMQMEFVTGKATFHPVKLLAAAYGCRVRGLPAAVARQVSLAAAGTAAEGGPAYLR